MLQKTILVTGGAGYIGSHTAWLLAQKGYNIIVLDNLVYNQSCHMPWATCIYDDVGNKEQLELLFDTYTIDAVMHFAAFIEVARSVKEPRAFYENNVIKTYTLLETMLAHNIQKIIFSSSCALYGIPKYTPIDEGHPKNPISPYGMSKYIVEHMLQDFAQAYGLSYVSLRYFNAAGATPAYNLGECHEPEVHIIPLLLQAMHEKKPFTICGTDYDTSDGTCIRDYVHVQDIAHAHYLALQHLEQQQPSDCFNLGTGNGISVKALIDMTEHLFDTKIKINLGKKRAGDPPVLIADPSKAQTILGWKPINSSLEHIIQSAYTFAQN